MMHPAEKVICIAEPNGRTGELEIGRVYTTFRTGRTFMTHDGNQVPGLTLEEDKRSWIYPLSSFISYPDEIDLLKEKAK